MIKIGCNYLSLKDTSVEDFIQVAYDLQLDCVDFHYRAFDSDDPHYLGKVKLMCLKYGLPIGYIGMSGLFVGNAEERGAHTQNCKDAIDRAFFLGSPIVRAFCAEIPEKNGDGDDPWPAMIAGYQEIADYAAAVGIAVGLQNHPSTGEQMNKIRTMTDRANFGFIMDTGQWVGSPGGYQENPPDVDFYEFMEQTVEHALYIRTKFYKIESGTEEWLDYERIAKIIKGANYNGCISVVYEGQHEDRVEQVRLGVKCLRELLA